MKATFSARVGWLGAVLSLLTFLSGKKVSVFFCELFFPKEKWKQSPNQSGERIVEGKENVEV